MHFATLAIAAALIAGPAFAGETNRVTPVSLPGEIMGNAEICEETGSGQCYTVENPISAFIIAYDARGLARFTIKNHSFLVAKQYVVVEYKKCRVSLHSYEVGSFCPGVK